MSERRLVEICEWHLEHWKNSKTVDHGSVRTVALAANLQLTELQGIDLDYIDELINERLRHEMEVYREYLKWAAELLGDATLMWKLEKDEPE